MTIRRRLSLSFFLILLLFAFNLVVYFWSNQRRQATVDDLRQAVSRQALISSLNQNLNDMQKQVILVGQLAGDPAVGDTGPADLAQFHGQLENIDRQIKELRDPPGDEKQSDIDAFAAAYGRLSDSWRVFYENLGINQTKAITELAIRSEPLARQVFQKYLPQLQSDENLRVDRASANFHQVAQLTDRITILIFAVSATLAVAVAFLVSRQLTLGLLRLKEGAASIGSGDLDRRIDLKGNDELADLARSFNVMAGKLSHARDQLVTQQKLASLGSLTAGIAHEIKNPLNFVTNFAEVSLGLTDELRALLIDQREPMSSQAGDAKEILADLHQNISKIEEHGKRADGIIRNMLMHSRGGGGERQLTNINPLLSEYIKLAYHGMRAQHMDFNITIKENFDPTIEPISVVAHDLSRVFLNIANNACYSAYEKKKKSDGDFSPELQASTKNLGSNVEIRIRDNGSGIPDHIRKRVFEPFFTTKPTGSGTGLGLSMSYDIIVQQHKGELRVESETGEYAEFIITLPKVTS